MARSFVKGTLQMTSIDENKKKENVSLGHVVARLTSPLPSSTIPYRIETSPILLKTEEAKAWLKRRLRAI